MFEDKLNQDQRIRLEALAQSIQSRMGRPSTTKEILERAQSFEKFVLRGGTDA